MFPQTYKIAIAAALALAFTAPANAARNQYSIVGKTTLATPFVSPPPQLHRHMRWVHERRSARALQGRTVSSTVVVGLETMRDLASLDVAAATPIPQLHAAEVNVTPAQLRALLANDRLRYVAPVGAPRKLLHLRNDPLLRPIGALFSAPYEWQFAATHVDRALNLSKGSPTILVGTVDSGVADIPDLAGKVDGRYFFQGLANGLDEEGHGTAVASLIAANVDDGFGMAGFGGATHLVSFRDDYLADTTIAIGILKLASLGCRIINLSIGGPDPTSPILRDAIFKAMYAGVLIVAAAGNDGEASVSYPAADIQPANGADSLGLAVGASDFTGATTAFSNTGANLSLVAPGDYDYGCSGVLAAIPAKSKMFDGTCYPIYGVAGGRYAYIGGTSFSAPEVAGVAALVWAARPELRNFEVADIVKRSAQGAAAGWTPESGYGVLDAAAALELATGRSSDDALSIADFRVLRKGVLVTARGRVVWSDGGEVAGATVGCSQGGVALVAGNAFTCSWRVPPRKAFQGHVTASVSEMRTTASKSFALGQPRVP
jgi:subtilisin family serine protease